MFKKEDNMLKLDLVHDLQSVYRKIVDSTSRPGLISDLSREAALIHEDNETGCTDSLLLLALTLLDPEVTFKVYSSEESVVTRKINQLTYAKATKAEQADYIFVLRDASEEALQEAIQKGKPGTLRNPHVSATILAEVSSVTDGTTLELTGPGIRNAKSIHMNVSGNWITSRMEKNKEYPIGIDLMFTDESHNLLNLPRTTQIKGLGVMV